MFSEMTKQAIFVSAVLLFHGLIMFMCLWDTLGTHRLHFVWRVGFICIGALLHLGLWTLLIIDRRGFSMDGATVTLVLVDIAVVLLWRWYDRRPLFRHG